MQEDRTPEYHKKANGLSDDVAIYVFVQYILDHDICSTKYFLKKKKDCVLMNR